jgi:YVTN family beta-propeller protein
MSEVKGREVTRNAHTVDSDRPAEGPVAVEIAVGNGPISDIAVTADGSRLMVTNYGRNSVSVIDADRCRVVNTVAGIEEPFAIAAGGLATNRAYASTVSPGSDAIAVIDMSTQTVVATHQLALSISDLAVCPHGQRVYVSRNGVKLADLAVLDTHTGRVDAIDLGSAEPGTTTECVRVAPDGNRAYVGVNGPAGGRLVTVSAPARSDESAATPRVSWRHRRPSKASEQTGLRILGSVTIGLPIRGVAVSPDGAMAYVASCDPDVGAVVDVIDTRADKITSTRKLGDLGIVTGLTLSADGDRAYLVSDDRVTVLCTLTHDVTATLAVTARPSCVVESPDGTRLYIADYSGTVTATPVASTNPLAIEGPASEGVPAAWLLPELEPALT